MGMAAKSKEPASETIMAAAKMKPLLALSKREPVQAALGLTSDGDGVVILDKKLKPKKLLAMLKAEAGKNKIQLQPSTLRFGKAEVDTDYDPGMVRFFVNKEAPGNMRAKMVVVFKQIAYSKVEFNVDPSFDEEPEEELEGEGAAAATAATTAPGAAPASAPTAPTAPPLDIKALTGALAQLMQAIPAVSAGDANVQKPLVDIATKAQGFLKAADLAQASAAIAELRTALGTARDQAKLNAQAAGGGGAVTYAKSRLAWLAARKKVESDIEALRVSILDAFKGDAIVPQLESSYKTKVAPVLATLDESLADALDAATNEADAAKRTKLVADAKAIIQKYAQYLTSEPLIKDLDENPFRPLAIRATVGGTISTLSKAIV
jgi:hypothetical protein